MTRISLYSVTTTLVADTCTSDLLAMASVLHRRGVEVVDAELTRLRGGRRQFHSTFRATAQQANTVLKSFENVVDVVDAVLFEALDARESEPIARLLASSSR